MAIPLGKRVKIKEHPEQPEGRIIQVYSTGIYTVQFDNTELIPPLITGYTANDLILLDPMPLCQCGVDAYGCGKHSVWCDKSEWEDL